MSPNPTVRGVVVIGLCGWLRANHGHRSVDAALEQLPAEHAELLGGRALIQTSRVPAAVFRGLADAIIEAHGLDGATGYRAGAAHVAESDLASYMKALISIGSPGFVLKRFPRIWRHYFDTGELQVTPVSSGADISIVGASAYGNAALEGAVGWMNAALVLSRARAVHVERLGSSDAPARYRVRWQ